MKAKKFPAIFALALAPALSAQIVYVGAYTNVPDSKGINAFRFDPATGKLTPLGLMAETTSPSFLAVAPNGKFLYAVNETDTFEGKPGGAVSAFSINPVRPPPPTMGPSRQNSSSLFSPSRTHAPQFAEYARAIR